MSDDSPLCPFCDEPMKKGGVLWTCDHGSAEITTPIGPRQICPTCGSDNLWEKTPGWLGKPEDNPAGAGCDDCKWRGTIGDTIKAGAATKEGA